MIINLDCRQLVFKLLQSLSDANSNISFFFLQQMNPYQQGGCSHRLQVVITNVGDDHFSHHGQLDSSQPIQEHYGLKWCVTIWKVACPCRGEKGLLAGLILSITITCRHVLRMVTPFDYLQSLALTSL